MESVRLDDTTTVDGAMRVTNEIIAELVSAAKWGKFLAILGFISSGIIAVLSLVIPFTMFASGSNMPSEFQGFDSNGSFSGILFFALYLFMAGLYFFPSLYLWKFSDKIMKASRNEDQLTFTEAFGNLKKLYRFMGVSAAIVIAMYAVGLLMVMVFASAF